MACTCSAGVWAADSAGCWLVDVEQPNVIAATQAIARTIIAFFIADFLSLAGATKDSPRSAHDGVPVSPSQLVNHTGNWICSDHSNRTPLYTREPGSLQLFCVVRSWWRAASAPRSRGFIAARFTLGAREAVVYPRDPAPMESVALRFGQVRNEPAVPRTDLVDRCRRRKVERAIISIAPGQIGRLLGDHDCAQVISLGIPDPDAERPGYKQIAVTVHPHAVRNAFVRAALFGSKLAAVCDLAARQKIIDSDVFPLAVVNVKLLAVR